MRILVFHGYLLRGTGSNVYNAELARALARAGHEVHLLCQDPRPAELAFVDAVGGWSAGGVLDVSDLDRERQDGWGRCTVYRPAIGSLLPVYVADRYEGFDARTFDRLTPAQVDHYLDVNVRAVREVAALAGVECALANHIVMGPAILARALSEQVPYAVKIHGSALEYTVRRHPRFLPFAREGLERAATVLVGSLHTAERLWDTLDDDTLPGRTYLGSPGVDVESFRPRGPGQRAAGLELMQSELEDRVRAGFDARAATAVDALFGELRQAEHTGVDVIAAAAARAAEIRAAYDPAGIDAAAPAAAAAVREHEGRLVLYVGKLIASKGVELLLAALPLVAEEVPDVRLAVVGFGTFREGLELLVRALDAGDFELAAALAGAGRALEGGERGELPQLAAFLAALDEDGRRGYAGAARGLAGRVAWFGRIEHDLLVNVVAAADVQVVPSTFPEAYGMVAAEAAACGVPPVCAHHSGLAEVTDQLSEALTPADAALLGFEAGDAAVRELAHRLVELLGDDARRAAVGARVATVAAARFSWDGVAEGVATAASGAHAALRRPV